MLLTVSTFFSCNKDNHDWRETYDLDSEEPYGISFFEKLIENFFPEGEFITVEEPLHEIFTGEERNANFLLVGQAFLFRQDEITAMLEFVENGNTAFFSTKSVPYDFLQAVIPEPCYFYGLEDHSFTMFFDSMVNLTLVHPDLVDSSEDHWTFYARRDKPQYSHRWTFISEELLCDSIVSPSPLGYVEDNVNFIKINYGAGEIFLHTTPIVFSNYHLREEQNLEYVEKLLAHLQPGDIYWDKSQSHRISENRSRQRNKRKSTGGGVSNKTPKETPLKYILSQPSLAWAWYTLAGMALLYLIFRAKRRQRVIPVNEPVTNTSLEFIDTIGRLYFQKGNPRQLILQKMKYLQNFIKNRYGLNVQEWDAKFMDRLSQKSNVPRDLLERIDLMYRNVRSSRFSSDNTLVSFHQMTEEFFRLKK